ncbi:MAG TPA: bile acid:sodium symporter [Kofleriaceae bacterium]|nr:bile acid:sodium symporter [Kofleriaceae bacterium]
METLAKAVPIAMLTFVVSSMLAVGLSLTVREIVTPLRNGKLLTLAVLANFVLMPLAAVLIARLLRLDQPLGVALLILGAAAGAPFLPKLASVAEGDLAFSVGLMVLLMVLTVGYMPVVMPLLLQDVEVDPTKIARSLVLLMLLPLLLGLTVRARAATVAGRAASVLNRVSSVSLTLMMVLMVVTNARSIMGLFGTRGVLASVVFLLVGVTVGWLLGGSTRDMKSVLALGTAQRNIAAALVVSGQNFDDPTVVVMVTVVAIVGLVLLMPLARQLSKPTPQPSATELSAR